jgi:SAM-dependent methyltransferase
MSVKTDSQSDRSDRSQAFFNARWQLYQKILSNNYMGHREIYDVLHALLIDRFQYPFKMLDLGCGDAGFMARSLLETPIRAYTGIDLSEVALEIARKNLVSIAESTILIQGDFAECLPELAIDPSHTFDIIFASFSLHHLTREQKEMTLDRISHLLSSDGIFVLVDIVCLAEENRELYLDRYIENVRRDWSLLEAGEMEIVEDHMRSSDFPETQETWLQLAQRQGLSQLKCLYRDPLDTTQILCFSRSVG